MLDGVVKFLPGQTVNGFRVTGYLARDSKNLPVYSVVHVACGSQTTMSHRRPSATKCLFCELQAIRRTLSQSESMAKKVAAIREYDKNVETTYEQSKRAPVAVPTPAPILA